MADLDETRRRFMAHFAGVGLGATLAPGILWARMQDAGTNTITLAMVTDALKLSGIELTEAERTAMVETANRNLARYRRAARDRHSERRVAAVPLQSACSRARRHKTKQPFRLSAAPAVKRPANSRTSRSGRSGISPN